MGRLASCITVAVGVGALLIASASPATAYRFHRTLSLRALGGDVRALEMRIAGWFPARSQKLLRVDRAFGRRTAHALKAFQDHFGLRSDGVAGPQTFAALARLEDVDGSTAHFGWGEFKQQGSAVCGRRADRYNGTFRGGRVGRVEAKNNVRRLMWRLEAIRAKAGGSPIRVTSGFRSRSYNRCVGGATWSQHVYGLAVDFRIVGVGAHRERRLAKRSQIHGLQCYGSESFNHIDLRMENRHVPWLHHWWWPQVDRWGHHIAGEGTRCWGE